jgi:Spy/CpxP family protein refolding chaperone
MFLRKLSYLTMTLALLAAFGAVGLAQQPATQGNSDDTGRVRRGEGRGFHRGAGRGGNFGPRLLQQLNLTEDQKKQIHSVIGQTFESNKATREELQQLVQKRRQGTLSADEEARARTLHRQMRQSMASTETRIAAVLTAEQKAKAAELIGERKTEFERGGRRRSGPPQPGQDNQPSTKPPTP